MHVKQAVGGKTVFGQLTVDRVTRGGFVTAYGCDDGIPTDGGGISKSDLNYDGAVTPVSSNRLIVTADDDGDICFFTSSDADMIIDINGITNTGVTPIPNQRTDTRSSLLRWTYSGGPLGHSTTQSGEAITWTICEEILLAGVSVCDGEPRPPDAVDPCSTSGAAVVAPVPDPSDGSNSMLSVGANANPSQGDAHPSNHVIVGAKFEPKYGGQVGALSYSARAYLGVDAPDMVQVGPEISIQHTNGSGVTQKAAIQYRASKDLPAGWSLWVDPAKNNGVAWDEDRLAEAPIVPPGSFVTMQITADLERGKYVSVTISVDGKAKTIDLSDVDLRSGSEGFTTDLVVTVEAENRFDCKAPADQLPAPTTGTILYDDLVVEEVNLGS